MKSNRVFLLAVFSLFFISLEAQLFVGGNVGFSASNQKNDNGTTIQKTANYSLALNPYAGKFLSEKLAVGLELYFSLSGSKNETAVLSSSKTSTIGVTPFLRYYAVKWNKFQLFAQGNVGFSVSAFSSKTAGVTDEGPKTTRMNLTIYPGIAYDVSEKISLQTTINILSVGYGFSSTKDGGASQNVSSFNSGAGLSNIVTLNAITIGGIYKF
jgi:outer membrane protein